MFTYVDKYKVNTWMDTKVIYKSNEKVLEKKIYIYIHILMPEVYVLCKMVEREKEGNKE